MIPKVKSVLEGSLDLVDKFIPDYEKLGNDNLFSFCLELGVLDGKTPKGSVMPEEMIKKILYEGNKDRILDVLNKTGDFIKMSGFGYMFFISYKVVVHAARVRKIIFLYIPMRRLIDGRRSPNGKIVFLAKKAFIVFGQPFHSF